MKKTFLALITILILAISAFGQLAKPITGGFGYINIAFNSGVLTDSLYWYGPYDVGDCFTVGGVGIPSGSGNTNDSVMIDLNFMTQGSSVAGAATYTVTAYLLPVPVRPTKNLDVGSTGSGSYGLTFAQLCRGDSAVFASVTSDGDTSAQELYINRDSKNTTGFGPPGNYLVFKVKRDSPATSPTDTKAYIQTVCVSRKRFL